MKKLLIVLALCVFAVSCCEKNQKRLLQLPLKFIHKEEVLFVNTMNSCIMGISILQTMEKNFYFILLSVLVSISLWKIKVYELLQYLL